jgi:hypothetical protein
MLLASRGRKAVRHLNPKLGFSMGDEAQRLLLRWTQGRSVSQSSSGAKILTSSLDFSQPNKNLDWNAYIINLVEMSGGGGRRVRWRERKSSRSQACLKHLGRARCVLIWLGWGVLWLPLGTLSPRVKKAPSLVQACWHRGASQPTRVFHLAKEGAPCCSFRTTHALAFHAFIHLFCNIFFVLFHFLWLVDWFNVWNSGIFSCLIGRRLNLNFMYFFFTVVKTSVFSGPKWIDGMFVFFFF